MNFSRAIVMLAVCGATVSPQYGGPAVLTRGQAPAAMAASQIDFRPYLSLTGGYDRGLNGVGVDPNGQPFNVSSYSVEATGGISGLHSWRHTPGRSGLFGQRATLSRQLVLRRLRPDAALSVTQQFTTAYFVQPAHQRRTLHAELLPAALGANSCRSTLPPPTSPPTTFSITARCI